MGFFDELKKEISQAVTELVSDEEMLTEEDILEKDIPEESEKEADEKEYLDEDDYIETEEDYATQTQENDFGVVVDDYASDEYVNTLDIDIADLVKSYSSELSDSSAIPYDQGGQNMGNNFMEEDYYGNPYAQNPDEDDVMVNTLDEPMWQEEPIMEEHNEEPGMAEDVFSMPVAEEIPVQMEKEEQIEESPVKDEVKQTVQELPIPEESEEPVQEEPVQEEPVQEEQVPEEPVPEEPVLEEPVQEEPVPEKPVQEELVPEEPVQEELVPKAPVQKVSVQKQPETEMKPAAELLEAEKEAPVGVMPHLEEDKVETEKEERMAAEYVEMKKEAVQTKEDTVQTENMASGQDANEYSDETALITKGLTVKGDLEAEGSINILGTVEGNISCKGKLVVSGNIYGNSTAGELFANNAHINGNIVSSGSVKIGQGSIIIGNVTGTSAVIAGAVKGDIDVMGPVVVDSSAIVMGDIKSKSVQINIGAAIEGRCSQCYADVSPTAFFKEN